MNTPESRLPNQSGEEIHEVVKPLRNIISLRKNPSEKNFYSTWPLEGNPFELRYTDNTYSQQVYKQIPQLVTSRDTQLTQATPQELKELPEIFGERHQGLLIIQETEGNPLLKALGYSNQLCVRPSVHEQFSQAQKLWLTFGPEDIMYYELKGRMLTDKDLTLPYYNNISSYIPQNGIHIGSLDNPKAKRIYLRVNIEEGQFLTSSYPQLEDPYIIDGEVF